MKVLLTGGTGFIGSHLAEKLLERKCLVHCLARPRSDTSFLPKRIKIIRGDLLDPFILKKAVREIAPDYVFHLGALTPVRYSFENPSIYMQVNVIGTINMIRASLESPELKRFFYASSEEVYESKLFSLKETDNLYGSTPYGVSKIAADHFVRVSGDCYGLPYTILRPCNTFGRKRERGYFIEKVITTMLTSNILNLFGSGETIRNWMYVSDHVDAYLHCMKEEGRNEVFNVGTKEGKSVKQIVEITRDILDWKGEVKWDRNPRPLDPPNLVVDSIKIERMLNWKAKISVEEGIKLASEYWKKKLGLGE